MLDIVVCIWMRTSSYPPDSNECEKLIKTLNMLNLGKRVNCFWLKFYHSVQAEYVSWNESHLKSVQRSLRWNRILNQTLLVISAIQNTKINFNYNMITDQSSIVHFTQIHINLDYLFFSSKKYILRFYTCKNMKMREYRKRERNLYMDTLKDFSY